MCRVILFFAYFLLCGFAAWREILRFLLQMTSKRPGSVRGRASRPAVPRDCPASGLVPTDRVKGWTSVSRRGSRLSPVGQLSGKVGRPRHNLISEVARESARQKAHSRPKS